MSETLLPTHGELITENVELRKQIAEALELAQNRLIELNAWRGRAQITDRELSCIKWAVPIIRGVEKSRPEQAGIREGEAMSDVLSMGSRRSNVSAA